MSSPVRAQRSAGHPPQQWSCAICTLDSPVHFRACEACGSSRPVGIDGKTLDFLAKPQPTPLPARAKPSSGRGAGRPPPPHWSCAICTLHNAGHSRTCEVCGSSRPVEGDADNDLDLGVLAGALFLPLQRPSRKRERAASPNVVGVCADEGNGATKGGEDKPAKKKGSGSGSSRQDAIVCCC